MKLIFAASATLNALLWAAALWLFPKGDPATILHYSPIVGVDFIGSGRQIYILPLSGLLVLGGNATLALLVRKASARASAILWIALLIIQIILILSFIILWRLNR
ncbi:MAG: hypothetical protein AAB538_02345 [Patescibacteria group bacterium]